MRVTRDDRVVDANQPEEEDVAYTAEKAELPAMVDSTITYTPTYIPRRVDADVVAAAMSALQAQLNEPLDLTITKQRKGYGRDEFGQPKMLTYLEWHTVTRQLNRIFGPSNWDWKVENLQTFGEDPDSGVPCAVSATATIIITWPNQEVTSYTNNGMEEVKRKEIWKNGRPTGEYEPRTWEALEMAFKGVAHDAFKRAATALGEQFGLSLYAKEEETKTAKVMEVVDGDAVTTTTATRAATTPRREAPRQQRASTNTSKYQTIAPEDYDADADDTVACENCGDGIHGYFSERLNRVYTTADLVAISKRKTGGQTLCYSCQNSK